MHKFATTVLALALATTHGLLDEGGPIVQKDASKGLRGSAVDSSLAHAAVGRKLDFGYITDDTFVGEPTFVPTASPTTSEPTPAPTKSPIAEPTKAPTMGPTPGPTLEPTTAPTSSEPTAEPTTSPTPGPSVRPGRRSRFGWDRLLLRAISRWSHQSIG